MAKAHGGHVLFGVREDGTILSVEIGTQIKERVAHAVGDSRNVGGFRRSGYGASSYGTNWRNTTVPMVGAVSSDDGTN